MHAAKLLLRPDTTALLVIDLQAKLMPSIADAGRVVANTKKMLAAAEILGLPAILTTQYEKGLGPTVPEITAAAPGLELIDKVCFGCFGSTDFREALGRRLPEGGALLLVGVETHICVLQTALGALAAGHRVHIVADAVGSRTAANDRIGLARMRDAGCVITSAETAIYELLGDAKREEFKRLLPYVK